MPEAWAMSALGESVFRGLCEGFVHGEAANARWVRFFRAITSRRPEPPDLHLSQSPPPPLPWDAADPVAPTSASPHRRRLLPFAAVSSPSSPRSRGRRPSHLYAAAPSPSPPHRYVSAGTSWLNGAFGKVGHIAGSKTREKFQLAVSNLPAKSNGGTYMSSLPKGALSFYKPFVFANVNCRTIISSICFVLSIWTIMFDCANKAQYMDRHREKFVRLEESSPRSSVASDVERRRTLRFSMFGFDYGTFNPVRAFMSGVKRGSGRLKSLRQSLMSGAPKTAFAEDLKSFKKNIFDPQDKFLLRMNRVFFLSCILAVAVDPLFFFLPIIDNSRCIGIDEKLAVTSTIVRTIIDCIYLVRMVLQFRTAYIAPSSRVFGTGELVIDPMLIARRYLRSYFIMDVLALLPLPQIVVWRYLHSLEGPDVLTTKNALVWVVLVQYIPRLLRIFPLTSDLKRTAGVFIETAWAGAAYYLLWFMLAGHNVGTLWYFLSVEREDDCWHLSCGDDGGCDSSYLYCSDNHRDGYNSWNSSTELFDRCNGADPTFNFGIYKQALQSGILGPGNFMSKLCYCFWWGLQSLSTLGQGLLTSTYPGEVLFSIAICVLGLILFALLIGNMQTYLQSVAIRLEEMRVKKRDAEQWMHHRSLPADIRERVRRYERYRWLETRGVDEENLVQTLPKDLRRDIKRHLCLGLVKRVPLFENMDERLLDAICERLRPALYTENEYILREGDPVDEMLFILHGCLESVTTDGGRSGFFNKVQLKEGDFCGEELLTWALDPKSAANFPTSTRTVKALSEVEAFALCARELKFVASQFRRLHSRQVQHTFRFYSQQWRTWAACFIQAAWRRYYKRKMAEQRRREEEAASRQSSSHPSLGATIYASRFAANALRGVHRLRSKGSPAILRLPKPPEPDFGVEDAD